MAGLDAKCCILNEIKVPDRASGRERHDLVASAVVVAGFEGAVQAQELLFPDEKVEWIVF